MTLTSCLYLLGKLALDVGICAKSIGQVFLV